MAPRETPPPAPSAPLLPPAHKNVLVIVLDALRAHNVGCYGYGRDTTPTIDAVARTGVRFERMYASAPYTTSSTWSLFTSLHPFQHGGLAGRRRPIPSVPTVQQTLGEQGFVTGAVSGNPFIASSSATGLARDFHEVIETFDDVGDMLRLEPRNITETTDEAIGFLQRHRDERFFLYAHYMLPHAPYYPAAEYIQLFALDPIDSVEPHSAWLEAVNRHLQPLQREQRAQLETRYDESIRYVDAELKRMLDALVQLGIDNDTLVVITADHGDSFWEHGVLSHGRVIYDDIMNVPLVLRGNGISDALRPHLAKPVSTVDLFPTLCDALGIEAPPGLVGRSLFRRAPESDPEVIQAFCQGDFRLMRAYWWPRFKLIVNYTQPNDELYDIERDPGERRDLADLCPVLTHYYRAQADAWLVHQGQFGAVTVAVDQRPLDEEQAERLKALGYFDE